MTNSILVNNPANKAVMRTLLLDEGSIADKRQELFDYFQETFDLYENLFTCLGSDEAYYQMADPLGHPLIFYFAHTATFFINKLLVAKMISQRINPEFESIFSVGVDEMSWDDLYQPPHHWPTVQSVREYRAKVREVVAHVILATPLQVPIRWEDPAWVLLMGIEHERIHLETSSVLIRQLPLEFLGTTTFWQRYAPAGKAPENLLIPVRGQKISLGKSFDENTYGWDNEYGHAEYDIHNFSASRFLVSNQEFQEFILDSGYQTEAWWTTEGWQWCQYIKTSAPRFWCMRDNQYYLRLLTEEIPMPWNWPVEVNYLESKAFCNWKAAQSGKNIRLLTEAEWCVMRESIVEDFPEWKNARGNINLEYYASPAPVDHFQQGELYDVVGNVWQWTETPIEAYPGFKPHPIYDDFSIPTFDKKHNIIKGGSWISTGNEATKKSRYAFRRHFYQHAGFRYIESNQQMDSENAYYESDRLLSEYLEFHFGKKYFDVENYAKAIADIGLSACKNLPNLNKALDLGCAVGRTAFELSKYFNSVYGVDFSTRFINSAVRLQAQGHIQYSVITEGELSDQREMTLESIDVTAEQAQRIIFAQGDACNLHRHMTNFDLIIAANLIDRLYDPAGFLSRIHERLNHHGILVISSPYTWLDDYTEKSKWLGGFKQDDKNVTTLSGMASILLQHFNQVDTALDVPFVIRETARKFQHSLAEVTVWQRK
jgi:5-histidylcysteine sulfoxide synthase/putative 4-mercaptohistidine N1-methyltranferase